MKIGHIALIVKDQDEAAKFYVEKLGFKKRQDTVFWDNMRWVTVSPKDQPDLELTFVKADSEDKVKALGKQAGDHVFLTLETDDCRRDYKAMKAKGVKFYGKPTEQARGIEVVFEDLYGNLFDLVQRF
ncbi:MAG: VOC family protein [Candidatus Bathyarchaeia archaeon]|jgi:catechol 2,3-dioxygenase-like lactoylglutathione lyase family enzyme